MRAGTSLLEAEDILSTNPLFLTNREAALSEKGEDEVRRACNLMKMSGITPTVVRYSLAASSIDSANIVGEELKIGRDRLVPEFNYMDPRAIGGKLPSSYMRRVLLHR
jgi:bisphosphoglycerate-dependent phosphoglycerate mutase